MSIQQYVRLKNVTPSSPYALQSRERQENIGMPPRKIDGVVYNSGGVIVPTSASSQYSHKRKQHNKHGRLSLRGLDVLPSLCQFFIKLSPICTHCHPSALSNTSQTASKPFVPNSHKLWLLLTHDATSPTLDFDPRNHWCSNKGWCGGYCNFQKLQWRWTWARIKATTKRPRSNFWSCCKYVNGYTHERQYVQWSRIILVNSYDNVMATCGCF